MKDIYVACEKMTKNGPKRVILKVGSIFNASDFMKKLYIYFFNGLGMIKLAVF